MDNLTLLTSKTVEDIDYCLNRGDDINQYFCHRTAFLQNCCDGNIDIVKHLIFKGCDVKLKDRRQNSNAFMLVCANGHMDLFDFFIEKNMFVIEENNDFEENALMLACVYGQVDIVSKLLTYQFDVNIKALFSEDYVIHRAVIGGCLEIVDLLIIHGVNLNVGNYYGDTPLHLAVYYEHKNIIERLLEMNVDTTLHNIKNQTALMIAKNANMLSIIKIFEEYILTP